MLEKAGMTMGQIDQVEINEAFAAQTLACQKEWWTQPYLKEKKYHHSHYLRSIKVKFVPVR